MTTPWTIALVASAVAVIAILVGRSLVGQRDRWKVQAQASEFAATTAREAQERTAQAEAEARRKIAALEEAHHQALAALQEKGAEVRSADVQALADLWDQAMGGG